MRELLSLFSIQYFTLFSFTLSYTRHLSFWNTESNCFAIYVKICILLTRIFKLLMAKYRLVLDVQIHLQLFYINRSWAFKIDYSFVILYLWLLIAWSWIHYLLIFGFLLYLWFAMDNLILYLDWYFLIFNFLLNPLFLVPLDGHWRPVSIPFFFS